jgi:hypothetical protein
LFALIGKQIDKVMEKFGGRHPPSKYCIWALSKKLETKGTLLDELTGGHPKMSEETIQNVKDRLQASPKNSLRRLSQESGLSRSTCQLLCHVIVLEMLRPLTTHNSQLTTQNSQLTTHNPQPTTHNSQPTTHNSQLTTHNSQLTAHNSQLTTHNNVQTFCVIVNVYKTAAFCYLWMKSVEN